MVQGIICVISFCLYSYTAENLWLSLPLRFRSACTRPNPPPPQTWLCLCGESVLLHPPNKVYGGEEAENSSVLITFVDIKMRGRCSCCCTESTSSESTSCMWSQTHRDAQFQQPQSSGCFLSDQIDHIQTKKHCSGAGWIPQTVCWCLWKVRECEKP